MKIYNKVITRFNDTNGQWETIYEDSFDYNGHISLAQGAPPHSTTILDQDTVSDTIKTTAGYFTDGDGTLSGTNIHTGSLSNSNEKYYFNVTQLHSSASNSEVQFSVAFGHVLGSGSNQYGDTENDPTNLKGETQAIYKQFANLLMVPTEVSGGFKISAAGTGGVYGSSKVRDEYIYTWIGKRDRFKDRLNKKSWTMVLSGSNTQGDGVSLSLTDDSAYVPSIATPGGQRYNIVSGSLGSPTGSNRANAYLHKTYGWFYPERGVMVFSGVELSASIPGGPNFGSNLINNVTASNGSYYYSSSAAAFSGLSVGDIVQFTSASTTGNTVIRMTITGDGLSTSAFTGSFQWAGNALYEEGSLLSLIDTTDITASFSTNTSTIGSSSGFAPNLNAQGNPKNALRFVNCLRLGGSNNVLQMRSEEDATQESYFCRIKSGDYNFSSNPTFVSGALNKLSHTTMMGNPSTFITGIGLYNSAGQLLAVAEMSKPLKKNFVSEATIKVKLTY